MGNVRASSYVPHDIFEVFKLKPARQFLSFFPDRSPVWGRGVARNLAGASALIGGVCVMLSAVALGEHYADGAIRSREQLVANDMVESVERVLHHVILSQREPLERLPGQPCETVAKQLAELKTYVRYVRGVNLVGVNSTATAREPRLALWRRIATDLKPRHFDQVITRELAFDELPGAFADYVGGRIRGRTIVRVSA